MDLRNPLLCHLGFDFQNVAQHAVNGFLRHSSRPGVRPNLHLHPAALEELSHLSSNIRSCQTNRQSHWPFR